MNHMHSAALDLDLNLLAVLDALFRERSVTKAATSLGLTQSAMSHSLNRLRTYFDDQLFVRSGSGMVPTRKAEDLRQAVDDVMAAVRHHILPGVRFTPATARRVFTFCMTDMGELVFLPPLLQRLKRDAPLCSIRTIQVPSEQVPGLLASGEADLAVGSLRSMPSGLYQQRLFLHSFVGIVSTRNNKVGGRLTSRQFESMPHVVVSLTGRTQESYDAAIDDHGIHRQIAVVTPHFLMVPLLMDRNPELIATVPLELANVFSRFGVVRPVELPVRLPPYPLNQHWHPRFHHDPAIVWLRGLVKQTFETYPDVRAEPPVHGLAGIR